MATFQNYVYMVIERDTMSPLGVYPNFKKAYERVEEIADGNKIVDCTGIDKKEPHVVKFNIVKPIWYNGKICKFCEYKYVIVRSLLTMYDDDDFISVSMIYKILEQYKKENVNYRLKTDIF